MKMQISNKRASIIKGNILGKHSCFDFSFYLLYT